MSSSTSATELPDSFKIVKKATIAGCVVASMATASASTEKMRVVRIAELPGTSVSVRRPEDGADSTDSEYIDSFQDIQSVLQRLDDESFEDGMVSKLAIRLSKVINRRPYHSVLAFGTMLASEVHRVSGFAEGVRWLSRIPAAAPSAVNNVIAIALRHPSGSIRDAAIVAADSLRSKRLIGVLRIAEQSESVAQYKRDIAQLVRELEEEKDVVSEVGRPSQVD